MIQNSQKLPSSLISAILLCFSFLLLVCQVEAAQPASFGIYSELLPQAQVGIFYNTRLGNPKNILRLQQGSTFPLGLMFLGNTLKGAPAKQGTYVINAIITNPGVAGALLYRFTITIRSFEISFIDFSVIQPGQSFNIPVQTNGRVSALKISLFGPQWMSVSNNMLVGVAPNVKQSVRVQIFAEDTYKNTARYVANFDINTAKQALIRSNLRSAGAFADTQPVDDTTDIVDDSDTFTSHFQAVDPRSKCSVIKGPFLQGANLITEISPDQTSLTLASGKVLILKPCTVNLEIGKPVMGEFKVGDRVSWLGQKTQASQNTYLVYTVKKTN